MENNKEWKQDIWYTYSVRSGLEVQRVLFNPSKIEEIRELIQRRFK